MGDRKKGVQVFKFVRCTVPGKVVFFFREV